ncbi:SAM-dependent methyltransferase [Haloprofundus marisrubri]|uniref:SAM-dependent methyltransferase n=2 Tax=Haloprofundus marisrubri TaxID=1514971 RepID=A0A0W1RAU7_9EURY|nr:SAM-dependent methyltransferase [Haloprofundus marisrubri]
MHHPLRYVVFSAYYEAIRRNHRHQWYAPKKRVESASFRSYELINKHGRDVLLRRLLRNCGPDGVVYDVGANTGVYSLAVAAAEPTAQVVAFEPNPLVAAQLRTNVACNGFESRIDVREAGVGAETGTQRFHLSSYDELGSFDARNAGAWEASVRDEVDVEIVAIDDIVDGTSTGSRKPSASDDVVAAGTSPPDHLKIDVEGYGLEVLRGARETLASARPTVYFEPHTEGGEDRTDDVAALLRSLGYRIRVRPDAWLCVPESSSN